MPSQVEAILIKIRSFSELKFEHVETTSVSHTDSALLEETNNAPCADQCSLLIITESGVAFD